MTIAFEEYVTINDEQYLVRCINKSYKSCVCHYYKQSEMINQSATFPNGIRKDIIMEICRDEIEQMTDTH